MSMYFVGELIYSLINVNVRLQYSFFLLNNIKKTVSLKRNARKQREFLSSSSIDKSGLVDIGCMQVNNLCRRQRRNCICNYT